MMKLNEEQRKALETAKVELTEKVFATQDVMKGYPVVDGKKDFSNPPVEQPVSKDDVAFLVDRFYNMVLSGVGQQDAIRMTYACCYRKSDVQFNPHKRIAELKSNS